MMAGSWGKAYHNVRLAHYAGPLPACADSGGSRGMRRFILAVAFMPDRRRRDQIAGARFIFSITARGRGELIGAYQGYNQIMPGYGVGDIPSIDEMRERVES